MPELLTTKGISSALEALIRKSNKELVLVSPYWQLSADLVKRLKDAGKRGVEITIVYGKNDLEDDESDKISDVQNVNLYFCKNLHAKCYYNENDAIITSMNFYEYSELTNVELGILIRKKDDRTLYDDVTKEIKYIIEDQSEPIGNGYCIRCGEEIDYDANLHYTMCYDCFQAWSSWGNLNYKENFCHKCGNPYRVCKGAPLCKKCNND